MTTKRGEKSNIFYLYIKNINILRICGILTWQWMKKKTWDPSPSDLAVNCWGNRSAFSRQGKFNKEPQFFRVLKKKRGRRGKHILITWSSWKYSGCALPAEIEKCLTESSWADAARAGAAALKRQTPNRRRMGDGGEKTVSRNMCSSLSRRFLRGWG